SPCSTVRSLLRTVHFDTNAPRAPCARTTPAVLDSSWFIRTVNVPSPLSKAPSPSGIPTIRYGVPSGLRLTVSPTVNTDLVTTPGCERTTYGDCELLGPVCVPGATAGAPPTVAAVAAVAVTRPTTASLPVPILTWLPSM